MWLHTVLVLSASNICAKVFQTCLGKPESYSSKKMAIFQLPPVNAYPFLTSSKACDWLGYYFGASTSPRPFTIKSWLWHPLPLFMAVSMIPNMWHSSILHAAFMADKILGGKLELARTIGSFDLGYCGFCKTSWRINTYSLLRTKYGSCGTQGYA